MDLSGGEHGANQFLPPPPTLSQDRMSVDGPAYGQEMPSLSSQGVSTKRMVIHNNPEEVRRNPFFFRVAIAAC
jgi:hypothetical protein